MNKLLRCLSIFAYPSDSEDEESEKKDEKSQAIHIPPSHQIENEECSVDQSIITTGVQVSCNTNENPESVEIDPEAIEVIPEDMPDESQGIDSSKSKVKKKKARDEEEKVNLKHERNQLVVTQIAVAEESARLRRKEKREKHRKEMSKWLGINAWKCDQKFLLNWGTEPDEISERVIIIRKRNVKKERQRRIDEFVLRGEISAAARQNSKKLKAKK